jgi:hypothetical protein
MNGIPPMRLGKRQSKYFSDSYPAIFRLTKLITQGEIEGKATRPLNP